VKKNKYIKKLDKLTRNNILENNPAFSSEVDSYLKWSPLALIFINDVAGVKAKNNFISHALMVAAAQGIRSLAVYPLKNNIHEFRPNSLVSENSFPSGHTATAFTGAEILRLELKDKDPVLRYAGYALATTTGILRLYNNKHWLSDVVTGMAIGIISGKISHWLFNKNRTARKKKAVQQKQIDIRMMSSMG
jgi:membrane-associated phospholipid phosphatase